MRWFIIRTIWLREMRDQLRDRRTLFMILGLPLVLYPLLGMVVLRFAVGFAEVPSVVGVVTSSEGKDFPPRQPAGAGRSVAPPLAWLSAAPGQGAPAVIGAMVFWQTSERQLDYPLLVQDGQVNAVNAGKTKSTIRFVFLKPGDMIWLEQRHGDLILEASPDFFAELERGEDGRRAGALLKVRGRDDDRSRLALRRLTPLLNQWEEDIRKVRLARRGMTEKFLSPFKVELPKELTDGGGRQSAIDLVVRVFPFLLVLWSLAGALYPAVDLCAGEKERGTMETLLITPAGREEIVLGKFLTIWFFSAGTALLNLLSMGITTALFASYLPQVGFSFFALFWCVVLSLPQSAFFSALSLAIGAYARSSKEGQYYLMPLFVVTMPLIFLTLAPGVELNAFYSMVPVTGVALLMQRLMTAPTLGEIPWAYFVPVLAPIALYSWLALRWAIEQFNREEVLFREAERLDLVLWIKSLLREKEPLPTTGQAFFCLMLVIGLRWLSLGIGNNWNLEVRTVVSQLAFVAAPALFMAILLNTRPTHALYLRWPGGKETALAAILAVLLLPPVTGLTQAVAVWFPQLMEGTHPLIAILRAVHRGADLDTGELGVYWLAFALVPALCEEVVFRGLVLRGLHARFRPRNAVLLSSFFFAIFHMNVFLFLPAFVLGVVLGLVTVRSRSLVPAIFLHLLHNTMLIGLIPLSRYSDGWIPTLLLNAWPWLVGICLVAAAALVWWLYRKPYVDLARAQAREPAQE
ncbi:MAG: CPBP family intramembrane metalloprotease [Planctomycetes bacterium]|nr:CPBP family intramembrane metalloprotease [Planctomycetota bacterium]